MNKKIDVSQQTVFDLLQISNFTYLSSMQLKTETCRLLVEISINNSKRTK
jgi:hypothetical protein